MRSSSRWIEAALALVPPNSVCCSTCCPTAMPVATMPANWGEGMGTLFGSRQRPQMDKKAGE
jgi:hypothetical protein